MPKSKCFSFTASGNWCLRYTFTCSGLRPVSTDLGDGTVMHCWVPKTRNPARPNIVLIHGFGANALWQFCDTVRFLAPHFNVYVPDLVFFGNSVSTRPDRTESFQAQCVKRVMEANSVEKMVVVGLSYGGFVAYSMAAQFEECVERVVICCAGVCLEEKDLKEGLFPVADVEDAATVLLPQTAEKMKELVRYTFVKPPKGLPSCLLEDFIDEMCYDYVEEKKELLRAVAKDRKLSDLPRISQPTLIVWGDQDRIFPVELANRLKRHLGENGELVVIKNTGHGFIYEKPKEFHKHLKAFLSKTPSTNHK
ncbi:putative hydrolase/acyltransferase (alpha/beta hydrolase superfamily) [Handroanthus impetiginosus]|uniref:Putative hydrolase/acyltransferase (Alpha/beta hydrolase superfamily) n=1 Tax=Handroanthus impetiginosus TaxID=429701 RepID=A0A2G9H190_9LAMI|nr:putative hydrolase/acyltransferase (alpha/beta hydrolase superfamily) [Handroanthus impetiginosus]